VQSASANAAHHQSHITKGKKKKAAQTSMQCPMMKGHSKKHNMMHHKMHHGSMMKCPMMGSAKGHKMGMTKH